MNKIKRLFTTTIIALGAVSSFAQYTNSGYFTDGYLYRHEINPAFGNQQNYISFPALGNINLGISRETCFSFWAVKA